MQSFDPSTGKWQSLPYLCDRRHGAAAIAVNGSLYAAGGMDCVVGSANADVSMKTLSSAEVYVPKQRCWRPIAPMQTARREPAGVAIPQ